MILVIGDIMLDHYVEGRVRRIAQEAPAPVFELDPAGRHSWHPGGAANVAKNIAALGERVMLLGAVGADLMEDVLRASFRGDDIEFRLTAAKSGLTTQKTRYIADGKQVFRVDREDTAALFTSVDLFAALGDGVEDVDAIVISDYGKGVVTEAIATWAMAAARRLGIPIIVDPKPPRLMQCWRGATVVKMNEPEAEIADADLVTLGCEYLIITRGDDGMDLYGEDVVDHIPAHRREVFDVVGAGDTVAAALAVALARGHSVRWSAHFANAAAGVVVGKRGTATASLAEIDRALQALDELNEA